MISKGWQLNHHAAFGTFGRGGKFLAAHNRQEAKSYE